MILITGGSGFIGERLVHELRLLGQAVRILDKLPSRLGPDVTLLGDVRDYGAVVQACDGVQTIFHLAAEHRDDVSPVSLYQDVNVEGSRNVLRAASALGIKSIIFTSTVAVYGLQNPAAQEDSDPRPFNEYSRSKLKAEELLINWAQERNDRSLVIVRPCVVYGEGNRGNVYNLLRQIHSGRFLMIGSGNNKKSLAYVGNVVRFLASLYEAPVGISILNYADKPDLTTRQLIHIADKYMGTAVSKRASIPFWLALLIGYTCDVFSAITRKELPVSSVRVRKFCAETSVSTARLDQKGFLRPFTLEDGLKRMIFADFPSRRPQGSS